MRPVEKLVHTRTRVRPRYALMPLEGFPASRLPTWPDAQLKVLASPRIGAEFVQYLIELPAGKRGEFTADDRIESFYYLLDGAGTIAQDHAVRAGSFGLLPPGATLSFSADDATRLLVLRKRYEPAPSVPLFKPLHGHESDVRREIWADNPHSLLQSLVPDEFQYDLAMNIFTFDAGYGLPIVETHVMEHGLYFLQGKGVYYLENDWMEVGKDDFIWMGPYCPQSFYATGPTPSRYLYYKNVNREIPL
jgi:(S)-ureidoglycine aminohydrolase